MQNLTLLLSPVYVAFHFRQLQSASHVFVDFGIESPNSSAKLHRSLNRFRTFLMKKVQFYNNLLTPSNAFFLKRS